MDTIDSSRTMTSLQVSAAAASLNSTTSDNVDGTTASFESDLFDLVSSFPVKGYGLFFTDVLLRYGPPATFSFGLLGHVMSLFVLAQLYPRLPSTSLYLIGGLILDIPVLFARVGSICILQLTDGRLDVMRLARESSNTLCKLVPFASDSTFHLSVWLMAGAAMETASVHRGSCGWNASSTAALPTVVKSTGVRITPAAALRRHRIDVTRATILLMLVLVICLNAHCFWTYALMFSDSGASAALLTSPSSSAAAANSGGRSGASGGGGARGVVGGVQVCVNALPNGGGGGSRKQTNDLFRSVVWPVVNLLAAYIFPLLAVSASTLVSLSQRWRRRVRVRRSRPLADDGGIDSVSHGVTVSGDVIVANKGVRPAATSGADFKDHLFTTVLVLSVDFVALMSSSVASQLISTVTATSPTLRSSQLQHQQPQYLQQQQQQQSPMTLSFDSSVDDPAINELLLKIIQQQIPADSDLNVDRVSFKDGRLTAVPHRLLLSLIGSFLFNIFLASKTLLFVVVWPEFRRQIFKIFTCCCRCSCCSCSKRDRRAAHNSNRKSSSASGGPVSTTAATVIGSSSAAEQRQNADDPRGKYLPMPIVTSSDRSTTISGPPSPQTVESTAERRRSVVANDKSDDDVKAGRGGLARGAPVAND